MYIHCLPLSEIFRYEIGDIFIFHSFNPIPAGFLWPKMLCCKLEGAVEVGCSYPVEYLSHSNGTPVELSKDLTLNSIYFLPPSLHSITRSLQCTHTHTHTISMAQCKWVSHGICYILPDLFMLDLRFEPTTLWLLACGSNL